VLLVAATAIVDVISRSSASTFAYRRQGGGCAQ
jgi:hypothetical protein